MNKRSSPLITISLPAKLLENITLYQEATGLKRSTIIQLALRDWLARQPPTKENPRVVSNKRRVLEVNGEPFDPNRLLHEYLPADISAEKYFVISAEYEAAEKAYYSEY